MRSALVIRHVQFEDLGAFASVLERRGCAVTYVDAGTDELVRKDALAADLLVVLGGSIGAYEDNLYPMLRKEVDLLKRRLEAEKPLLGICLGAQLIARALGADVYRGPTKEIGWSKLTLSEQGRRGPLRSFEEVEVLHWHGDTFDLPAGAERLASTPTCANQAFSIAEHTLAFQFHPEAREEGFERWLIGHACEIAATPGVTVTGLRRQASLFASAAAAAGQCCLEAWLSKLDPATA